MVSPELAEVVRRGQQLYAERLRPVLEPGQDGRFIAIEPDSGDYFLGDTALEAIKALRRTYPDQLACLLRVGYPAVAEIGFGSR